MTSVRFLSITKIAGASASMLEPAPSISDWEEINAALKGVEPLASVDDLLTGEHPVRASYRGGQIYLYPNVRINRIDHRLEGWNGYTACPKNNSVEEAQLRMNGSVYSVRIKFSS